MGGKLSQVVAYFSGRVQGVGFRYSTRELAQGFELTGTVENLHDGRVRLEMEGEERELKAFLEELKRQMASFIRDAEEHWGEGEAKFRGFSIVPTQR